jgi:hypothetical protein
MKFNKRGEKTLKTLCIAPAELLRFCVLSKSTTCEGYMKMSGAGLEHRGVDACYCAMIKVSTKGWNKRHSHEELCVEWDKIIGAVGKTTDLVTLRLFLREGKEEPERLLEIVIDADQTYKCTTTIDCNREGNPHHKLRFPRIPKHDQSASATIDGFRLKEAVKRIEQIGSLHTLTIGRKTTLSIKGELTSRSIELTRLEGTKRKGESISQYSGQYLTDICSVFGTKTKPKGHALLLTGTNHPLTIRGINDLVNWDWMVAPRVEGEA